jgi:hypothetical protein
MCFTLAFLEQIIVWLIIVGAIVALIKLLIPFVTQFLGGAGSTVAQALNIVLYAFIAIIVVYIIFALINCLVGAGGLHLPH